MKKTTALSAALLFVAATAALPAAAEHRGHDRGDHHSRHDDHDRGRHADHRRGHDPHRRHHDDRREHDRYARAYYVPAPRYVAPRGYRGGRWAVGTRLPPGYYVSSYYVDPYAYRLSMPPRGYRWVRVDRDVYLVSVASGLIRDVLYGIIR